MKTDIPIPATIVKSDIRSPARFENDYQNKEPPRPERRGRCRGNRMMQRKAALARLKVRQKETYLEEGELYDSRGQGHNFKKGDKEDYDDLMHGPFTSDELDWLIAYNRQNIPKHGILRTPYWTNAATKFNREFNKRRSPRSLLMRFWNGDIAARIRTTLSQRATTSHHHSKPTMGAAISSHRRKLANETAPITHRREEKRSDWTSAESNWFSNHMTYRNHGEYNFPSPEQKFKSRFEVARTKEESTSKWCDMQRQRYRHI